MEEKDDTQIHEKNGNTNGISVPMPVKFSWHVNITSIDISHRNIVTLDEEIQLPANLLKLNLSHNKLHEVPAIVSKLEKLMCLDLSHNAILYFDETPNFCQSIESLDLSTNDLHGPPYWIWTNNPKNLTYVNLSCNTTLTKSFVNKYLEELLQYKTYIEHIDLFNCGLRSNNTEFLSTFSNANTINIGTADYCYHGANVINEAPSKGLEQCTVLKRLNLSNTHIYTIESSIAKLKNLCELNLACNNISGLPNEFCTLINLETCVLSNNSIIYLPDDIYKLAKLRRLSIDCNKLCMLPEKLSALPNLKALDLYDNCLYEILEDFSHVEEFDVALNYMDEPDDISYLEKKERLRLNENRGDGRKPEEVQLEKKYSWHESDSEEYNDALFDEEVDAPQELNNQSRASSPEDWDSDSHWIPHDIKLPPTSTQPWIHFIQRKIREGNFCPIDAHVVSVSDQVMYEKKLNPRLDVECEGQFDDYSSDDS